MQASLSPLPLLDLCHARVAYLMWTRHDVSNTCASDKDWDDLRDIVMTQTLDLRLPDKVKSDILEYVKLSGENLLFLLTLWLSKTQPMNTKKWLPQDILFDCLILNGDGLINYSKTAEKILSSKILHSVFAFRLACVNFLEVEVLKLWPLVMQYFLNKMLIESEHTQIIDEDFSVSKSYGVVDWHDFPVFDDPIASFNVELPLPPYTMEPTEVLYWINYCLSKERAVHFEKVPHLYEYSDRDESFLMSTVSSGNVAYFDRFRNCGVHKFNFLYQKMHLESLVMEENHHQAWFISYYVLLTSEDRAELFRKRTRETLSRFLQWPLSFAFLNNAEEIWNVIPDEHKHWLFLKVFVMLFEKNRMVSMIIRDLRVRSNAVIGLHLNKHLEGIFVALWNLSPDSYKYLLLNTCIIFSIRCHYHSPGKEGYRLTFDVSDLKQKLCDLFVAKGEAIVELYSGVNMKESVSGLVNKYMPGDSEKLHREWISGLDENIPKYLQSLPPFTRQERPACLGMRLKNMTRCDIAESFVIYVQNVLLPPATTDVYPDTRFYKEEDLHELAEERYLWLKTYETGR